jgi:ribose 5-phosphate isomerase A
MRRQEEEKQEAAEYAVSMVRDGDVVGLGSGTTASDAIRFLAERVRAGLKIRGIPTSVHSGKLARKLGIPLTTLDECPRIDVTIDGADEVDLRLRLIKGGGGALLREKIIASASRRLVIVADSSKQVKVLGQFPLPVEVVPFAQKYLAKRIAALGARVRLRKDAAGKPYVTDGGHHILDCHFGKISHPARLARQLEQMPGVAEHGLFLDYADVVVIAKGALISIYRRRGPSRKAPMARSRGAAR